MICPKHKKMVQQNHFSFYWGKLKFCLQGTNLEQKKISKYPEFPQDMFLFL